MIRIAVVAAILFVSQFAVAQNKLLCWNEERPLQWHYFLGQADESNQYDCESYAEVKYSYTFHSLNDFHFDVRAYFNPETSWVKSGFKTEALLKHEQTHFDIAELYARKLKQALESKIYSENFDSEIKDVFNQYKEEYHKVQKLYDEETIHSTIAYKQKQWESYVSNELQRYSEFRYKADEEDYFAGN